MSRQAVAMKAKEEELALLRARFGQNGLYNAWTRGSRCALFWALKRFPDDLWVRSGMIPAERTLMLGATSKRMRGLLAGLQRRVPVVVRVVHPDSVESMIRGLPVMMGWCNVVSLEVHCEIGRRHVTRLARVLGQCSSLAELDLRNGGLNATGARSIAGALGACSALTKLGLSGARIGDAGARSLAGVLRNCTSLVRLDLSDNLIGDKGVEELCTALQHCPSLAKLYLSHNDIDCQRWNHVADLIDRMTSIVDLDLSNNAMGAREIDELRESWGEHGWGNHHRGGPRQDTGLNLCGNLARDPFDMDDEWPHHDPVFSESGSIYDNDLWMFSDEEEELDFVHSDADSEDPPDPIDDSEQEEAD